MTKAITALCIVLLLSSAGFCATEQEQARAVVDASKEAIITIELVIEVTMSYEGETEKQERKSSATGLVIDPSGLVVTSLAAVNPADSFSNLMEDGEGEGVTTQVKDLKVRLDDGTEAAYDMVLRDPDLDLAFMKPKKPLDKPVKSIDLTQAGTPQMMDRLVLLYRLGSIAGRSLAGTMCDIQAVVNKPRTFYVMSGTSMFSGIGCPAFTLEGKPAGLLVVRASKSDDSDGGGMSGMSFSGMIPIVLPCSTVAKAAEQAKTAKPEAVAKPAPKPAAEPAKPAPAPKKPVK